MKRRRSILLALLLSFFAPGLGLLYVGKARKAGWVVLSLVALITLVSLTHAYSHFYGYVIFAGIILNILLFSALSAASHAANSATFRARAYNHPGVYLAYIAAAIAFSQGLSTYQDEILGGRNFRIPSDSMRPNLIPNDFILVDTRYRSYQPGDVVVFDTSDKPGTFYVKRIAAMGGDRLAIRNGKTVLNGEISGVLTMSNEYQQKQSSLWLEELSVPEGMVYVLGDKRDQSHDSRNFDAIPEEALLGRVTDIWFSLDTNRIGQSVR